MNTQDLNALLHSLQAWHLEGRRESIDGTLPPVETAPVVVRQDTLHQVLLSAGLPVVETVKRLQDLGWVRVVEGKPAPSWRAAGTFASSAAGRIGAMTDRPSPAQQPLRWYAIESTVMDVSRPVAVSAATGDTTDTGCSDDNTKGRILDILRQAGRRLTAPEIGKRLDARKQGVNPGTVKNCCRELMLAGKLTNSKDILGKGYGLPEWTT